MLKLGVSADIIKEACDEFYCEEDDYAKEINVIIGHINKKINSIDIKDYNQLQKLKASLYRKGFRLMISIKHLIWYMILMSINRPDNICKIMTS